MNIKYEEVEKMLKARANFFEVSEEYMHAFMVGYLMSFVANDEKRFEDFKKLANVNPVD